MRGQDALSGRRDVIKVDLRVLGWAIKVYKNFVPVQQIELIHEQLADMLQRETDLVNEAAMIARMAKNFESDRRPVPARLSRVERARTVLTMTFMDGVKITKKDASKRPGSIRTRSRPS